jgi:hypothetical protein
MCFPRKPNLGQYRASRAEWRVAYRIARCRARVGRPPNPRHDGIQWKAELIVANDRNEFVDPLACPVAGRLAAKRIIDEITATA